MFKCLHYALCVVAYRSTLAHHELILLTWTFVQSEFEIKTMWICLLVRVLLLQQIQIASFQAVVVELGA